MQLKRRKSLRSKAKNRKVRSDSARKRQLEKCQQNFREKLQQKIEESQNHNQNTKGVKIKLSSLFFFARIRFYYQVIS